MTEAKKSLTEQIYERLFVELAKAPEFDAAAVAALKELSPKAGLKKSANLLTAIKTFEVGGKS